MNEKKFKKLRVSVTDPNLKLQELGLYLTMLSLPDKWQYSVKGLSAILSEGQAKISNTIKQLEKKQYMERKQNNSGRFGHSTYIFQLPGKVKASFKPCISSDKFTLLMDVLKNKTITLEERGLYAKILFLPSDWKFSVRGLTKITADQKLKITSTLKKLIANKLVEDIEIRKNGRYLYHIYDITGDLNSSFKKLVLNGLLRDCGSYFSLLPKPEKTQTENSIQYHNTSSNDDVIKNSQRVVCEKIVKNHIDYDLLMTSHKTHKIIINALKDALVDIIQNKKGFIDTENGVQLNQRIAQKALMGIKHEEAESIYQKAVNGILKSNKINNLNSYVKKAVVNYASGIFIPVFEA